MRLSDTLTRGPADLPEPPGPVRIYSCGPTVYQRIHVGNAVPFVFAMWLRRWLQHTGYEVQLAINITDVERNGVADVAALVDGRPARRRCRSGAGRLGQLGRARA